MIQSASPLATLLLPAIALACPVCGTTTEQQRVAFVVTTGILTFLPLLFIGGGLYWLRRRHRALTSAQQDHP